MDYDLDAAYEAYVARFESACGKRPGGAFVKFGKHMIQKLSRQDFPGRLDHYLKMHRTAKEMLAAGSTINDAVVLEFDEASAWLAIQAPDMLKMFSGEIGDPAVAKGERRAAGPETSR